MTKSKPDIFIVDDPEGTALARRMQTPFGAAEYLRSRGHHLAAAELEVRFDGQQVCACQ